MKKWIINNCDRGTGNRAGGSVMQRRQFLAAAAGLVALPLNTHDIRVQSGHPALSHETIMGKPDGARKQQQTTKWYINTYLHADRGDALPLDESALDGLQFGGKRNYGYGITGLNKEIVFATTVKTLPAPSH